jgi:type IV pilus assembly protein PilE
MNRTIQRGFTLIEVLVVVGIIGILAAISYPAYSSYLIKGNRAAAQSHLLELAQAQQQYLSDARAYTDTLSVLNTPTPTAVSDYYTISVAVVAGPPTTFTLTATPKTGKRNAADGNLTINSSGVKTPSAKW